MRRSIIAAIALGLIVYSVPVFADTNGDCGGHRIISLGDRYEDVLSKCGDPDDYSYFINGFGVRVAIELRYDKAKGQFPTYFYFDLRRDGVCTRIRLGAERR
jgi:hypothetical protein